MDRIVFSHNKDDWETPQWLFDELNKEFHFNWDAAATKLNSKVSGGCYFNEEMDALKQDWYISELDINMRIFCNPPYSLWQKFVEKAFNERCNEITVVMLLPARTDTKAFHRYIWNKNNNKPRDGVEVRFLEGRLKFEISGKPVLDKHGRPQPAPFPSMVVIFRGK